MITGHVRKWIFQMKTVTISGRGQTTGYQSNRRLGEPRGQYLLLCEYFLRESILAT